jgi:hypothetical protein
MNYSRQIQHGEGPITNTMNGSTGMAWYWITKLKLSTAIPRSIPLMNGNNCLPMPASARYCQTEME